MKRNLKFFFLGIGRLRSTNPIPGAVNDVVQLREAIRGVCKEEKDVVLMHSELTGTKYPSLKNSRNQLALSMIQSTAMDSWFLHISGHGASEILPSGKEVYGIECEDGKLFSATYFARCINRANPGTKVTCCIDMCKGAGFMHEAWDLIIRKHNVSMISSCGASEFATEYTWELEFNGSKFFGGILSHGLLHIIKDYPDYWPFLPLGKILFDTVAHCRNVLMDINIPLARFFKEPVSARQGPELLCLNRGVNIYGQLVSSHMTAEIGLDQRILLYQESQVITALLAIVGISTNTWSPIPAREITRDELAEVHTCEHIESVDFTRLALSRLTAGLCADVASSVVSGHARYGFAFVRPPGHHIDVRNAARLCLYNNAAVAALAAQAAGAEKVLIVDWDGCHRKSTQDIFYQNKSVLYISLHRHEGGKCNPGTGAVDEVGGMGAEGYCVNIPWNQRVGDNDYMFAFQHIVRPIAVDFAPDFVIISAGFSAARGDPQGYCEVTPTGYAGMTDMLKALSGGKLLVIFEGGYTLPFVSSSATSVIKVLLGESSEYEVEDSSPSKSGLQTVIEVLKIQRNFWSSLGPIFENLLSQYEEKK